MKSAFSVKSFLGRLPLTEVTKIIGRCLRKKPGLHDFQILNCCGINAQKDLFHTHFHLIPRFKEDGCDWQPILRKDLKEQLAETYEQLKLKLSKK